MVSSHIENVGALNVTNRCEIVDKVKFKIEKFDQRHKQHEVVYDLEESKFA